MTHKFALIIGNSDYQDMALAKLVTPGKDATRLAEVLRAPEIGGFDDVIPLINEPETILRRAIERLFAGKKKDDTLLMYFSGHGVLNEQGQLYLAVRDTEHDLLNATAIPASFIRQIMDESNSRRQVLMLDCCNSGAFGRGAKAITGKTVGTAAAFEGAGYGRVVLTATDAVQYAWEGEAIIGEASLSVFTHFLVEGLQTGAADADGDGWIGLDELYDYVHEQVVKATPKQRPAKFAEKQLGQLVIARNPRPPAPAHLPPELQLAILSPSAEVRAGALEELGRLIRGNNPALATAALEALKQLTRQMTERARLSHEQQQETEETPAPPKTEPATVSAPGVLVIEHPFHLELIRIPAGEFLMGSDPAKDKNAQPREQPQHRVYVSEFYIGKYPVTNAQYAAFTKIQIPSGKENHPVVNISWDVAVAFCEWLSQETGKQFRLPTEAEWEKAARGTDGRIYPWGNEWDAKRLNSSKSKIGGTTPVGKYSPAGDSPYGLADMSGNVWEWCADSFDEKEYQRRGGSTVKDPQGPKTGGRAYVGAAHGTAAMEGIFALPPVKKTSRSTTGSTAAFEWRLSPVKFLFSVREACFLLSVRWLF